MIKIKQNLDAIAKSIFMAVSLVFFLALNAPVAYAGGVSLFLFPPSGSYGVGDSFNVSVKVDSGDNEINASEGVLVFNPKELEVVSISKSGSFFTLWTKDPVFSNIGGKIEFGGGTQKGFFSSGGTIMSITFRAKISATSQVNFSSGAILAADGMGTNVLTAMQGGVYTLATKNTNVIIKTPDVVEKAETPAPVSTSNQATPGAPEISSPSHPDSEKWYKNSNLEVSWGVPGDVTGMKMTLDHKATTAPLVTYTSETLKKSFDGLEDGTWYFHLQFKNRGGWGAIAHRQVLIDTQPPQPFEISVDYEGDQANPTPLLRFEAVDKASGIANYEVKIDQVEPLAISPEAIRGNAYRLSPLAPGHHTAIVKATDMAGNTAYAVTDISIEALDCAEITALPENIRENNRFYLSGSSKYPDAAVSLVIKKDGQESQTHKTTTDSNGNWTIECAGGLKAGNYQTWIHLVDSKGRQTLDCHKGDITVSGSMLMSCSGINTILLMLIALLIIFIAYAWYRISQWRDQLEREAGKDGKASAKALKSLRKKIQQSIEHLDNLKNPTDRERKLRNNLQESLDSIDDAAAKKDQGQEKEN